MIVSDEPCPQCRANGRDKTGNHLIVFSDGGKFCNRCGYNESTDLDKQYEEADMESVMEYSGDPIRGIKNSTRNLYGCKVLVSEETGEPSEIAYPKGSGWKIRKLPKDFYAKGRTKDPSLFGKGVSRSNTLVITGGEEDAMAAYDMLKAASPHNHPAVVSLPDGEQSLAAITKDMEYVQSFQRVVSCLDMDEAGEAGTDKLVKLLEGKVCVAEMPCKDPNECLLSGAKAEFVKCIIEAKKPTPSGIVRVSSVIDKAMKKTEWGVPFPWKSLTLSTYGMRHGDGYYIGAGVKCGKSEWLNELVKHLITLGKKPFIIKGEEQVELTAVKLAGKLAGKIYHRPDVEVDDEEKLHNLQALEENLLMYDRSNSLDWDALKVAIRHAVIVEGCEFVFIDPIVCMTDGMEASEANTFLQKFSREIDQMAKDLGFTYFVFTHLNSPRTGLSHERGGRVESYQFTGSRSMMRATTYMIGIERNKDPDIDEDERNTSYFVLLEDRNNGNTCRFPVKYNKDTGDYLEPETSF